MSTEQRTQGCLAVHNLGPPKPSRERFEFRGQILTGETVAYGDHVAELGR